MSFYIETASIYRCEPPRGALVTENVSWQGLSVRLNHPEDHPIRHALFSGTSGTSEIAFWLSPHKSFRRIWCMVEPDGAVAMLGKFDSMQLPEVGTVLFDSLYGNRVTFLPGTLEHITLRARFNPTSRDDGKVVIPTLLVVPEFSQGAATKTDYPNPRGDYHLVYGDRSFYTLWPPQQRMRVRVQIPDSGS
jgi:hypothetical protein